MQSPSCRAVPRHRHPRTSHSSGFPSISNTCARRSVSRIYRPFCGRFLATGLELRQTVWVMQAFRRVRAGRVLSAMAWLRQVLSLKDESRNAGKTKHRFLNQETHFRPIIAHAGPGTADHCDVDGTTALPPVCNVPRRLARPRSQYGLDRCSNNCASVESHDFHLTCMQFYFRIELAVGLA